MTRIQRAGAYIDAQHDRRSTAHGLTRIERVIGRCRAAQRRWSDDPALSAEEAIDLIRDVLPSLEELRVWAEDIAHQSYAPAPERGATIQ